MTNASVESLDTSGEGVKANVKTANGNVTLEADIVLFCGRNCCKY